MSHPVGGQKTVRGQLGCETAVALTSVRDPFFGTGDRGLILLRCIRSPREPNCMHIAGVFSTNVVS
ncbi:hypothetical protein, partial [Novipirellula maiorica]|uniref:hypothetical protein n=1 Tax=Novipirellula maiorica TaxID=1265734 RepID=UPI001F3A128A